MNGRAAVGVAVARAGGDCPQFCQSLSRGVIRSGSFCCTVSTPARPAPARLLGVQLRGVAYHPRPGCGTARDYVAALSDPPAGLSDPSAYHESIRRAGWTARATSRHIWPWTRSRSRAPARCIHTVCMAQLRRWGSAQGGDGLSNLKEPEVEMSTGPGPRALMA